MARLRIKEVLQATGGELLGGSGESEVGGVAIDSRTVRPGELFVCIIGQSHDGHRFAVEAVRRGAAALLISSPAAYRDALLQTGAEVNGTPAVMVRDTAAALQELATYVRGKNPIPLIAVTGSNGKTTTKELIVSILQQRYAVLKNQGNLNNLIGLPLSLLQMSPDHTAAVLEMGMNSPGEIARLSRIARPNIGVITNVSAAHLSGLGSVENILKAKGELVDSLGRDDTLVLNLTDSLCAQLASRAKCRLITFGSGPCCAVRCKRMVNIKGGRISFALEVGSETIQVELNVPGRYNAYNAAGAAAAGLAMKMELGEIKAGLEQYRGLPMRSEILKLKHGIKIYNDCYNANPKSMQEALKTFAGLTRSKNSTVILGDMLELGEGAGEMHYELGRLVASIHCGRVMAVGAHARDILTGAMEGGMAREKAFAVGSAEEAAELAPHLVGKREWVMVKGSRGVHLEKVVERLKRLIGEY